MAKEDITLRLDGDQLRELRELVGTTDLAAAVDAAIAADLTNLHGLKEADEWIEDLKRYEEARTLER
jgi:hypothetical protein